MSRADQFARSSPELATTEEPAEIGASGNLSTTAPDATGVFSKSVLISGIRCLLAYVIFPWILPLFRIPTSVGPWIGIVIGVVAIGFNIASIRRFWVSRHRWRWAITALNSSVIVLLSLLFAQDVSEILI